MRQRPTPRARNKRLVNQFLAKVLYKSLSWAAIPLRDLQLCMVLHKSQSRVTRLVFVVRGSLYRTDLMERDYFVTAQKNGWGRGMWKGQSERCLTDKKQLNPASNRGKKMYRKYIAKKLLLPAYSQGPQDHLKSEGVPRPALASSGQISESHLHLRPSPDLTLFTGPLTGRQQLSS